LTASDWGVIAVWGTHEHSGPFSVVETSPLNWILRGVWNCLQPLHVLVPSSRSLKIAHGLDYLVLRSCIALFFGWMGSLLELLLDSRHGRVDLAVGS
jgi:hypothetical protein